MESYLCELLCTVFFIILNISNTAYAEEKVQLTIQEDPAQDKNEITEQQKADEWHYNWLNRDVILATPMDNGALIIFKDSNDKDNHFLVGERIYSNPGHHGSNHVSLQSIDKQSYTINYSSSHTRPGSNNEIVKSGNITLDWSPELFASAFNGDTEKIQSLLDSGTDVNERSSSGRTALMVAAYNGQVETMLTLIASGANQNLMDSDKKTALHSALECPRSFSTLLSKSIEPLNPDPYLLTNFVMFNTKTKRHMPVLRDLISRDDFDINSKYSRNSFMGALRQGYVKAIQLFIEHGIDVNKASSKEPVLEAIENPYYFREQPSQRLNVRRLLLAAGANETSLNKDKINKHRSEWIPRFLSRQSINDIRALFNDGFITRDLQASVRGKNISMLEYIENPRNRSDIQERYEIRQMLIEKGFTEDNVDQEKIKIFRKVAFEQVLKNKYVHEINILLDVGIDVNGEIRGQSYLEYVQNNLFYTEEQAKILKSGQSLRLPPEEDRIIVRNTLIMKLKEMGLEAKEGIDSVDNTGNKSETNDVISSAGVSPRQIEVAGAGSVLIKAQGNVINNKDYTGGVENAQVKELPKKTEKQLRQERCQL